MIRGSPRYGRMFRNAMIIDKIRQSPRALVRILAPELS
jgi:hypothetical protein